MRTSIPEASLFLKLPKRIGSTSRLLADRPSCPSTPFAPLSDSNHSSLLPVNPFSIAISKADLPSTPSAPLVPSAKTLVSTPSISQCLVLGSIVTKVFSPFSPLVPSALISVS